MLVPRRKKSLHTPDSTTLFPLLRQEHPYVVVTLGLVAVFVGIVLGHDSKAGEKVQTFFPSISVNVFQWFSLPLCSMLPMNVCWMQFYWHDGWKGPFKPIQGNVCRTWSLHLHKQGFSAWCACKFSQSLFAALWLILLIKTNQYLSHAK